MLCLVEASEQCPSHCLGLHQATAIRPDKLIVPAGDSHPDDSTHDFILGRCANIQVPSVQGEGIRVKPHWSIVLNFEPRLGMQTGCQRWHLPCRCLHEVIHDLSLRRHAPCWPLAPFDSYQSFQLSIYDFFSQSRY